MRYERDLPQVKHTGLFGTVYHRRAAQLAGFDDVLFVDGDSHVLEGATWNVGFVQGDQVVWPKSDCLPGVTMRLLKSALADAGTPSAEAQLETARLAEMRYAFITNAAVGVCPVALIDERAFPNETTAHKNLQELYAAIPDEQI